ncbi:hypothetical protein FB00_01820 [Cellulosimicrobium funkei]|uniref:Uncharacterized protein n=1 Tax=Cellulosimicrobium funkei TaxID=264251 RepID=A0A0H2KXQ7_9MICO|nr:hypothetical protein [Cellulosimicrobium funkei]KLN36614.1 hypothetical protein FB00_01820 [Cellulosimicrobium funkei]
MAVRFVPPPGWPVPEGFTPTTDWHPDPSWPAPPPGWVFWEDAATSGSPVPVPLPDAPVLRTTEPLPSGAGTPTRRSLRARSSGATPAVGATSVVGATPVAGASPAGPGVEATHVATLAPVAAGAVDDHPVAGSTMILPALGALLDDPAARPAGAGAAPTVSAGAARSGVVPVGPTPAGPAAAPPRATAVPARASGGVGPLALPGADDDEDAAPDRGRRWLVPTAVGLAGVALGLLVGIGLTLSAQGEAQREKAEAQRVQSEVAAEREQLESERADLEAQRAELDAATTQLTEREAAITKAEEDAAQRSQELDDRQKQQDERDRQNQPGPGNDGNGNNGNGNNGNGENADDGSWDWGDWGW